jgi:hypothetical protein
MSQFHEAPFAQRYAIMGDIAESVFEDVEPKHHRLGYNRPPFYVANLPLMLRNLPDYMIKEGLVEVMGIGKDKTLKLKVEKLRSLLNWQLIANVELFVYDSHRKQYWRAPIMEWELACAEYATMDRFPDDLRPYYRLNSDNFPNEGKKLNG